MKFNKICMYLKPFLNGLSFFLGVLFLGLMSCSSATVSSPSSPTEDKTPPTVEDNIPPTVAISTNENLEIGKTGTITFAFSERVKGFIKNDIQLFLNRVSVDKGRFFTNNLTNYFLEITPKTTGTLTIVIPANSFYDLSGNQNTNSFSSSFSVVEDKTPPTVTISTNENLEKDKTGTITFTFSEEVKGFAPDDIQLFLNQVSVDKGSLVTGDQKNYFLEITPKIAGALTVTILSNSFEDLSGNQNTDIFSSSFSVVEDKTPPTVTISTNENLEKDKTGTITFTFSEKVINFTPDEIQLLMNGVTNSLGKDKFVTNGLTNYFLDITPKIAGTLTVSIPDNSFEDLYGNQNTDIFSSSFSVVEDKTPPTVIISTNESLEIGKTGTITFTFSENVTNFTKNDVKFSSSDFPVNDITIGNFTTNNSKEYSLKITPKLSGTLTITIPANSFYDLSGNQNTNNFSNSFWVRENIPPTVAISTKENLEIGKTGTITFTFSENVTNFTKDDVKFSSDDFPVNEITIGNFTTNNSKEYSLKITPKLSGTLTVTVPDKSFEDLSANQNTDSFSTNFLVEDKILPTVTSINTATLIEGESAYLSFIFSENVNNFTPDDIQFLSNKANGVNNVVKGKFVTNSQKSYSLQITPKEEGILYVSIPAKSFEDLSGNQNDKAYSNSFTVLDSSTTIHTISFKLNGGSFISPQITNLKVVSNEAIEETKLGGILSYPPTGPKPNIEAVTRGIFEWQTTNGTKYDFSTLVSSDLTLEAVWSNSCGKVETFHPAYRYKLENYVNAAVGANATTNLNHIDTSAITDMTQLFYGKDSFNGEIGCWNTTKVNNLAAMFFYANAFNQDIGNWDVANVNNMEAMFYATYAFNQDISSWDVGNVNNMNHMFSAATDFNQDISTWNVANVTSMRDMFANANVFNQPIGSWNVTNVINMGGMFQNASSFNQDISSWDVANVNNMHSMFFGASAFNQDISKWDVANVTRMRGMFANANVFNQDLSGWDVGNVTDMNGMFSSTRVFNQDISRWDVANVTDMSYMFNEAWSFNQDISNWDVGKVTNMSSMFKSATAFNQDISNWNVGNVTDMSSMFLAATAFNQDISGWDVANVTDMRWMFSGTSAFNQDLSGWSVSNVNKHTDIFTGSAMATKTSQQPTFP